MKKLALIFLPVSVLVIILACLTASPVGANPGVVSGTISGWPQAGPVFLFDGHVTVNSDIEAWWSTALVATPSGWFYGNNASTEVALAPGITDICQVADASIYPYDPHAVGVVYAGDFVLFHNTSTGYYAAFRVDNIYGLYPNYLADITWYLQEDGSANFGPCVSDIDVDPLSLSSTQSADTTVTDMLTISNTGYAQLDWAIYEDDAGANCSAPADISWASVNLSSGMTAPGGSSPVEVTFDSTGLTPSVYTGNLCLSSNDPDPGPGNGTDLVIVPLELTVQGVASGTIIAWPEAGPVFLFDDHVTVNSDIEAWWSTALVATPSGWFYGNNASTEVALAPGITDICQVADASIYTYDPHAVGVVYAGDFVLFHNTSTGYYAAFRVDNIYGPFPNYLADITWYLPVDGSGNFGPCVSDIDVDPLSLSSTQSADTTVTDMLTISNTGYAQLDWAIYEDDAGANCSAPADISWASVNLSSGMTAPGGSSPVEVTFDSTGLTPGVYTGNLCLSSNDPDPGPGNGTDLVIVPLELTVQGVASGTIIAWPEAGPVFLFDDHVTVNSDIEAWWSTALVATPSGWFYGNNASTEVALAPGITDICQVTDASIYTYDPNSVGVVYAGDFVLFHNTSTGYYAAFRVDNIYGPFPNYLADITWYLPLDGSGNFGPCVSDIDVDPLSLSSTQPWNTTVTDTLTISNTGDAQLDWTVFEEDTATYCSAPADISWASVNLSSGMTAPGGSSPVEVTFDSTGLYAGTYTGNLCISSNDPDPGPGNGTDLVVVPLELTVETVPSIDLVKTVGLDPASCATSSTLTVVGSADVYYCYEVTNTGNITLTLHDLDDSELGNLFTAFPYDLAPGASVDTVTAGLEISATITQTTVNNATWTAYNPGLLNTAEATASATVTVEEIPVYTVFLPMIFVPSSSAQVAGQPAAALP